MADTPPGQGHTLAKHTPHVLQAVFGDLQEDFKFFGWKLPTELADDDR